MVVLQRPDLILKPGLPAAYVLAGVFFSFTWMTGRNWMTFSVVLLIQYGLLGKFWTLALLVKKVNMKV